MVTELPWDEKSGTLRRDLAPGMINPACKHALEAALQIQEKTGAIVSVLTMGPPAAEEVLREALALGANRGILISDKRFAGSDTYATSLILASAIKKECPHYDLILCGAHTSDSETAQVGPQLAEELQLPAAAYAENMEIKGRTLCVRRLVDNFRETLEMEFPALVTVSMEKYLPRYTTLAGLENAFVEGNISICDAGALSISDKTIERFSRTSVRKVYLRDARKENVILTGTASAVVTDFLNKFENKIGAAIGKTIEDGKADHD